MFIKIKKTLSNLLTTKQEHLNQNNSDVCTNPAIASSTKLMTWSVPVPINSKLSPVHKFSTEYLPEALSRYVFNAAQRINNASPEFVGVSCLVSIASLIGDSAVVQPKKLDSGWTVVPTLWSMLVGEPSTKKSPCMAAGTSLLSELERNLFGASSEKPRRLIVNDTTPEALAILLAKNPKGVLVVRDELASWLINLDQDQKAYERGFYLQAFNGNTPYAQERVTRESVTIDPLILSIVGGIQPSRLNPLLSSREQGKCNDGLFERFQLIIMPDQYGQYMDIPPDTNAVAQAKGLFNALAQFSIKSNKKRFTLSAESSSLWDEYSKVTIEREQQSGPLMQAILGKYPTLCAKLALILHMCEELSNGEVDSISTVINRKSMEKALLWMSLLESHSIRVQSLININKFVNSSEKLLNGLNKLNSPFSLRCLERKNWKYLTTKQEREEAVLTLCRHGFLKEGSTDNERKSLSRYHIHPEYRQSPEKH
jgi:hypothetical protein